MRLPRFFVSMRPESKTLLALAKTLPQEELPELCADLEQIRVTAVARLTAPIAASPPDELLDVAEVARRLHVSSDFVYRAAPRWPFTRRQGRKLLFSSTGLDSYLRRAR